jgi:hypothetical protein
VETTKTNGCRGWKKNDAYFTLPYSEAIIVYPTVGMFDLLNAMTDLDEIWCWQSTSDIGRKFNCGP